MGSVPAYARNWFTLATAVQALSPVRVLVVERHREWRRAIAEALTDDGLRVEAVSSRAELEPFTVVPHILVTDDPADAVWLRGRVATARIIVFAGGSEAARTADADAVMRRSADLDDLRTAVSYFARATR